MSQFRYVIFLKQSDNPIIMTEESDETKEQLAEKLTSIMQSDKVVRIDTEHDSLVIRPSSVPGILVASSDKNDTKPQKPKPIKSKPQTEKYQELIIE